MVATTYPVKAEQRKLYEHFRTDAKIMDAPFDEERVGQFFGVFERFFLNQPEPCTSIMMRVDAHKPNRVALRYSDVTIPHDPYKMALDGGLIKPDGHPVFDLYGQMVENANMIGYGADFSSNLGLEKIWPYAEPMYIDDVHDKMPAVPQASREHKDFYHKYNLTNVSFLGMDYPAKTMNVYFFYKSKGDHPAEEVSNMLVDLGFEEPSEDGLAFSGEAIGIYLTFDWDTTDLKRLCFCAPYPKEEVPRLDPLMSKFIDEAPRLSDKGGYMYCRTYGKDFEPFYKVEVDYAGMTMPVMSTMINMLQ